MWSCSQHERSHRQRRPAQCAQRGRAILLRGCASQWPAWRGVTIKLPDDVSPESLDNTTLVALLNLAQPSPAMASALARFVSAAWPVIRSATAWTRRHGTSAMASCCRNRWTAAHGLGLPGQHAGESSTIDQPNAWRPSTAAIPCWPISPNAAKVWCQRVFFKYMLLDPAVESPDRSVILRYESGALLWWKSKWARARDVAVHHRGP